MYTLLLYTRKRVCLTRAYKLFLIRVAITANDTRSVPVLTLQQFNIIKFEYSYRRGVCVGKPVHLVKKNNCVHKAARRFERICVSYVTGELKKNNDLTLFKRSLC